MPLPTSHTWMFPVLKLREEAWELTHKAGVASLAAHWALAPEAREQL